MAIFNENFVKDAIKRLKDRKENNRSHEDNHKKQYTDQSKDKKHGIITKEEYEKCKSIIASACNKYKILKDNLDLKIYDHYEDYLKSNKDEFAIGGIIHDADEDNIWEDSDRGINERENKHFKADFMEFMNWYMGILDKVNTEINKKFIVAFGNQIKFNRDGSAFIDRFWIESKKPKEDKED